MDRVIVFTFLSTALIVSSLAENTENPVTTKDSPSNQSRSPKVSSDFGYSIQNSDPASSHFRQEQRDPNGVVRGSYGFKNPNGEFRLVQYVADDKGFRAHISSNEHGIGKQNPASVSINRFEHQPIFNEYSRVKPPISTTRLQNYGLKQQETKLNLPGYEFYSPIAPGVNSETSHDRINDFASHDNNKQYESDSQSQKDQLTPLRNPIDKLIRTRLGIPGEFLSILRGNKKGDSHPIVETSSASYDTYKHHLSQNHFSEDGTKSKNLIPNDHYSPNNLYPDSFHDNILRTLSSTNDNFNRPNSNYPQFVSNVHPSSQHKVHTSLPDCKSASSAVLCKPPALQSGNFFQPNIRTLPHSTFDENPQMSSVKMFLPDKKTENLDSSGLSSRLLSNLMPNSYSVQPDIYKYLFDYNHEKDNNKRVDPECDNSYLLPGETILNSFNSPVEQQNSVNNAVSKVFPSYDFKRYDTSFSNFEEPSSQYNENREESNYYSSLVKIMQNDHSLNKLNNLLMRSSQLSSNSKQTPILNMFGILILPSHLLKELSNNNIDSSKKTSTFDEKNLPVFGDDIFESDIIDETEKTSKDSHYITDIHFNENTNSENNEGVSKNVNSSKNKTEEEYIFPILPNWNNRLLSSENKSETDAPVPINSEFFVFDDTIIAQRANSKTEPDQELDKASNSSTDNWRKVLEEEINKEYERTSLQQETRFPGIPADIKSESETDTKNNQRQYTLHEHTGPLYDSTGRPIKPENVPIHIHRYVPPAGITSFPWKFSIPRPAPPRSIVVPPKPPTLS